MLSIEYAKYIGEYKIHVKFNNGKEGVADLEDMVKHDHRPIIAELRDRSIFSSFKVDHSTVIWPNEADLAPEYLFYLSFKNDCELQSQFKEWGYIAK